MGREGENGGKGGKEREERGDTVKEGEGREEREGDRRMILRNEDKGGNGNLRGKKLYHQLVCFFVTGGQNPGNQLLVFVSSLSALAEGFVSRGTRVLQCFVDSWVIRIELLLMVYVM